MFGHPLCILSKDTGLGAFWSECVRSMNGWQSRLRALDQNKIGKYTCQGEEFHWNPAVDCVCVWCFKWELICPQLHTKSRHSICLLFWNMTVHSIEWGNYWDIHKVSTQLAFKQLTLLVFLKTFYHVHPIQKVTVMLLLQLSTIHQIKLWNDLHYFILLTLLNSKRFIINSKQL